MANHYNAIKLSVWSGVQFNNQNENFTHTYNQLRHHRTTININANLSLHGVKNAALRQLPFHQSLRNDLNYTFKLVEKDGQRAGLRDLQLSSEFVGHPRGANFARYVAHNLRNNIIILQLEQRIPSEKCVFLSNAPAYIPSNS